MSTMPAIPDKIITVVADGFVLNVACDDDRLEAVLEGLQCFLAATDTDLAVMRIEPGENVAAEQREAEQVQRSAMLN